MLEPRIAILFPGVGSQFTGMGGDWYDRYSEYRDTFDQASDCSGIDLNRLCRSASERVRLSQQLPAQLAVFTHGLAVFRVLHRRGLAPAYLAGHSLGEVTALCAADALTLAQAVALIGERGKIIEDVSSRVKGTMAWILNLRAEVVDRICASLRVQGSTVSVSSFDTPSHVTVSGQPADVDIAVRLLEQAGASVLPLPLAGAYHSPLMSEATQRFAELLREVPPRAPAATVLANADGLPHAGGRGSANQLARQLSSPVQWTRIVAVLEANGVGVAVDVGPKGILAALLSKTTQRVRAWIVDRYATVELFLDALDATRLDPGPVIDRCLHVARTTRAALGAAAPAATVALTRELERLRQIAGESLTPADATRALSVTADLLRAKGLTEPGMRVQFAKILDGRVALKPRA